MDLIKKQTDEIQKQIRYLIKEKQTDEIRKRILYLVKENNGITATDVIDGCRSRFYGAIKFDSWHIMDELDLMEDGGLIEFKESKYYYINDKESKN
jgi:predicted transcriptional regulator